MLLFARPVPSPQVAILDPAVTASLPGMITAATGMDALTHAVESYLSQFATAFTREYSLRAVQRIGRHLLTCYREVSRAVVGWCVVGRVSQLCGRA